MTQTAKTYGQALYELARDERLDEEILAQLSMAAALLQDNPRYLSLLSLPSVPKMERCAVLDESFRGQVHPYVLNFLKILVENGSITQLGGCTEHFRTLYNEDHGILEVTAVSAAPLDAALREKLLEKLAATTGKQVDLTCRVDESLLGGMRLEMDGKRLDGTVQNRLAELRTRLRETVL